MECNKILYTKDYIELCGFASPEQTKKEANFVIDVLKLNSNSKILDLCCGFGRHTHAIASLSNCQMVGLDLSDDYLKIAKEQNQASNIKYIKGDMRNIPYNNNFDSITNLFTSFGFFEKDEENELVIKEISSALKVNGHFLLDYENKFFFVRNDVQPKQRSWRKISENKYHLIENDYDVMNDREIYTVSILEDGKIIDNVGYNIRLYGYPEIKTMLARNNLEIVNVWGDYDGNPFSVISRRVIILARKIK